MIIDFVLLLVIAVVAWMVASEGPWSAAITLCAVVLAGLLTMSYFEMLGQFIESKIPAARSYADLIAFIALFAGGVTLIRLGCEQIMASDLELDGRLYQAARWVVGVATGYATMAILLTSLHTAPLPREFLGFSPERDNFFNAAAPDRQWLAFTQYVTEKGLWSDRTFDLSKVVPPNSSRQVELSTFVLKYATRRDQLSGNLRAAMVTPATTPPAGGASGGAPAAGGF